MVSSISPGDTTDEILISSHICHPSLANDNLSGVAVASFLARYVARLPRTILVSVPLYPGTIGAIAWLCFNESMVNRIRHGLVLAGVGDAGPLSYKKQPPGRYRYRPGRGSCPSPDSDRTPKSWNFLHMAMMSDSIARPAFNLASEGCLARPTALFPSITPPLTI